MESPPGTAAVVGGGIGGVAAALALTRIGWSVQVLERCAEPADRGSGITLFPNALRALDAIGVGQQVRAAGAVTAAGGGLRRPDGRVLVDGRAAPAMTDLYAFHRADLHRALREQLPAGVLETGVEVIGVGVDGSVHLAGRASRTADLVVAADGLRSAVRTALRPRHPGLRYAGYTSWRAVTATPVEVGEVVGETWGAGMRFGILPLRDGRVYWFAVANRADRAARAPRRTSPGASDAYEQVRRRFARWHRPIPALLDATAPESVLALDIHDLQHPLPSFAVGRVALLGDAAHAMTPDVGQGAGQACEDAAVLAARLVETPDVPTALRRYDAERRPRTERVARVARRMGRLAQTSLPLAVALRTALIRLTPPQAAARTIASITSWAPPVLPERGVTAP